MELHAGKVVSARVYIDRAVITRRIEVELSPADRGLTELTLAPIPIELDVASIVARLQVTTCDGSGVHLDVHQVSPALIYADRGSAREKQLSAEKLELESKLNALNDAESTEAHVADMLQQYAGIATATLSREWLDRAPSFDKWGEAFDHLRTANEEHAVRRALRGLQKQKLLERRADLLEEELRLGQRERLGYRLRLGFTALPEDAKTLSIELSYMTRAAQWMPIYDARLEAETLELTSIALVRQNTGEDWENIELCATTARPPLSEPMPELATLQVRSFARRPGKALARAETPPPSLNGVASRAPNGADVELEHVAPGKVSVPSTNRAVRIELFCAFLPAKVRLETVPMARPVAVFVASAENTSGRVLLPGTVNVFRGASYVGQTQLGFISANEKLRLPFGTDASVRIKRELVLHPEKQALLSGATTASFTSRITLENLAPVRMDIVVRDRIPVSRAHEATVKVGELAADAELDADSGALYFELALAPREKKQLATEVSITSPRGFDLSNLLSS